jgi:hypothetical protein
MRSANYVEETTTSIAGAGGIGAVTLTAISGLPRFSSAFGTQATTIRYVIEDTVGKRMETGIGSVASNVLTRTRPQTTWDGTTYDDTDPSPIAFGASPTSGNIKVRLAAVAESQGAAMAGRNLTIAGSGTWGFYPLSANKRWNDNGAAGVIEANTEYYSAYLTASSGRLTGIALEVMTAVAASTVKMAIYACGTNGLPAAKIADLNEFNSATTGIKTDTVVGTWSPSGTVFLPIGWYYIGYITGGAVGLRGSSQSNTGSFATPIGRVSGYGYSGTVSVAGSFATGLPASPAPSVMEAGHTTLGGIWLGLRIEP